MIFFLILLIKQAVCAESVVDIRHKLMFGVENPNEYTELHQKMFQIEEKIEVCQLQWKEWQFPTSCYWLEAQEITDGRTNIYTSQQKLDQRCKEMVEKLSEEQSLEVLSDNINLSQNCKKAIAAQLNKIKYVKKMARKLPKNRYE